MCFCFFFNVPSPPEFYPLSLHDALPISRRRDFARRPRDRALEQLARPLVGLVLVAVRDRARERSEEHTSELQSLRHLVCRLLLEKKNNTNPNTRQRKSTKTSNYNEIHPH